jgi:hypothetical protein
MKRAVVEEFGRPTEFLRWAVEMFGPIAKDKQERALRFIEEAIELAHAAGLPFSAVELVALRVYDRPPGEVDREIGQAQACLETMAENLGLSADIEAEREFARVKTIPKEEWQRRHRAKVVVGIAR